MTSQTLPVESRALRVAIALTTSLTIFGFTAAPAIADKRTPAPIVFAGQGGSAAPVSRAQRPVQATPHQTRRERRRAAREARRAPPPTAPARRIEFRYPDQPDTFYGAEGARSDVNAAPLSFSSSTSTISQADAAKYTVGTATAAAPAPLKRDPAITSGGFDARAAAARVSEREEPKFVSAAGPADFSSAPIQSTPLPDLQGAVDQSPAATMQPVSGAVFQPVQGAVYDQRGKASVFNPVLNGQPTSNGEILDTQAMIAAHPSLPLPSLVQVINLENNREVVVRVNDRGPIDGSGLIEVSERAANVLRFPETGVANVRIRYLGKAPELARPQPAVTQTQRPAPAIASEPASTPLFASPQKVAQTPIPETTLRPSNAGANQFLVQLASFSDISNAQRLYSSLGEQVSNIGIVPVRIGGADYFRVVAGPLDNRQAAEHLRDRLANQGVARGLVIAAP